MPTSHPTPHLPGARWSRSSSCTASYPTPHLPGTRWSRSPSRLPHAQNAAKVPPQGPTASCQKEVLQHPNIIVHALPNDEGPTARSCRTPTPYALRQPDAQDQGTTCREHHEDPIYPPPGPNDRARPPLSATRPHRSSPHDLLRSTAFIAPPPTVFCT